MTRNRVLLSLPIATGLALAPTLSLMACNTDAPESASLPGPTRDSDPAEPRLDAKALAFEANPTPFDTHFKTQVIGYNDDYGVNINAKFLWLNTTSGAKVIRLVSYSAPGTSGSSTLNITLTLGNALAHNSTRTKWVSGAVASSSGTL